MRRLDIPVPLSVRFITCLVRLRLEVISYTAHMINRRGLSGQLYRKIKNSAPFSGRIFDKLNTSVLQQFVDHTTAPNGKTEN